MSGDAEYDPSHSSVGENDPGPSGDGTDPGLMYPRNGDPTDFSGGCMIDGGVGPCSVAMSQVNVGAGVATDLSADYDALIYTFDNDVCAVERCCLLLVVPPGGKRNEHDQLHYIFLCR